MQQNIFLAEKYMSHSTQISWRRRWYTIAQANALAAKEYMRGNYEVVVAIYHLIIEIVPEDAEAYNNLGCALRELGRYEEALASYDKAIKLQPAYAMAYNNRGVVLYALNRHEEALKSYDRSLTLQPGYAMAYNNLGVTLHEIKRYEEALISYNQAIALKHNYAEAYNNRCNTLFLMNRHSEALASCDRALALKRDYAKAHNNRGFILKELRRFDEALASYDKSIELDPVYFMAHNNRGLLLQEMKRYDEALANYDKAIELNPDHAEAYNNRGDALVSKGDMQGAEAMFLKALELKPDYANPLFSLTGIRTYDNADHPDCKNIQYLLDSPDASTHDQEFLYFSLGKIYDDCGLYDTAFENYRQANQLCNDKVSYNPSKVTQMTDLTMEVFSKEFLVKPPAFASDSLRPLFIVGMQRSGTTLMASILSNHRAIDTAGELLTMMDFTLQLPNLIGNKIPYPQAAKHLTPAIAAPLIQKYEQRLMRDADAQTSFIIDKYPLNFQHLGLIAMLFPKARVIHCTRHPLDTCLSNYFQRFFLDYSYSFDLSNIGHFYGEYTRLIEHWRKVLPLAMIDVSYEEMIRDTRQTTGKILDFLGLEWDECCLSPHANPRPVETASKWQVRQPIYDQSIGRWRHYDKYLEPLKEMLGIW